VGEGGEGRSRGGWEQRGGVLVAKQERNEGEKKGEMWEEGKER